MMKVLVKTIAKVEYSVQCSKDQTVLDVKTALEERGAGNASDMKLLDAGHALDDETKITDVDVVTRDGGFVVLMNIPKRKKPSKRPHRQGCEKAADTSSDKRATDLPKQGPVPMGPPRSMIAPGPPIVAGKNETLESYARDAERKSLEAQAECRFAKQAMEIAHAEAERASQTAAQALLSLNLMREAHVKAELELASEVEGARSAADEASAAQAALKKTSEEHESTATRTQMLREAVAMQVDEGQDLLMAVDGLDITEFQESVAEKSRDSLHMDAEDLFSAFLAQTPMTTTDSAAKDGKNAGTPPGTRGPRCA